MSTVNLNRLVMIILSIILLTDANTNEYKIELLIFSGRVNPTVTINETEYKSLTKLIEDNKSHESQTTRVMGYKGFLIPTIGIHLHGFNEAEKYLLTFFKDTIPNSTYHNILELIEKEYIISDVISTNLRYLEDIEDDQCEKIPIRGLDSYPEFNPESDDLGCFKAKKNYNNCYNYGTDIVTNTFAQPGLGSGQQFRNVSCPSLNVALGSDGLVHMGNDFSKKLENGHYVALLIHPNTDFHFVRLDVDGYWSHKPGAWDVTNKDNNGNVITDPSKQDFSPWFRFCAYYAVVPSKVTIG
jgi:hypothetical protein